MKFKTLLIIFFAIIIVIFALQNAEVTEISFLAWNLTISRVLVILGSFTLGILVGILVTVRKKKKMFTKY